jgi:LemA protein
MGMSSGLIITLIGVFAVLAGVAFYNRLITLKNRTFNGFSQIEVQLQRRYELIPNLVNTAKAYMSHEADTLKAVTEARNNASEKCEAAAKNPEDASLVSALASADSVLTDGTLECRHGELSGFESRRADA